MDEPEAKANFFAEASVGKRSGLSKQGTAKKAKVDLVAQLVEHNTFNVRALGSSPSGITSSTSKNINSL